MAWTNCRFCRRPLLPRMQEFGFCNADEKDAYALEKERVKKSALEAFRLEGEPNRGTR